MPGSDRSRVDLEMFSDAELWQYLKARLDPKYNWERYLVGDSAVRISGLLTAEQKDLELVLGAAAQRLAAFEQECRKLQSKGRAEWFRAQGEHAAWRARVMAFKRLVDRRAAEARRAAKVASREMAEFADERKRNVDRQVLRELAVAVHRHRQAQLASGAPVSSADSALWRRLEELTVEVGQDRVPLLAMVERGTWTEGRRWEA